MVRKNKAWQQSAGGDGGKSSHDTWDIFQPQGKWREISTEMDTMENTVEEKSRVHRTKPEERVQRETPNCKRWSRLQSWMKNN